MHRLLLPWHLQPVSHQGLLERRFNLSLQGANSVLSGVFGCVMSYGTVHPRSSKCHQTVFRPFLFFIGIVLNGFGLVFFLHCFPGWFESLDLGDVTSGHRIATVFRVTKIKVTEAVNQEKSAGVRKSFQPFRMSQR